MVWGKEVSKAKRKLNKMLSSKPNYQNFSVSTFDIESSTHNNLQDFINWFEPYNVWRDNSIISKVELLVTAVDEKHNDVNLYVMVPAHVFLEGTQHEQLLRSENSESIFEGMEKERWYNTPYILSPHGLPVKIVERPLPAIKYLNQEQTIACDAAICKIDKQNLEDALQTFSHCQFETFGDNYKIEEPTVNITDHNQLQRYIGRKVLCGNKKGRIEPQMAAELDGQRVGSLIAFTLEGSEP